MTIPVNATPVRAPEAERAVWITKTVPIRRSWGDEHVVIRTATHCGKILDRLACTSGDLQFHVKEESHYLLSGRLAVVVEVAGHLESYIVQAGESWTVPPGVVHQERALVDCRIFEVSDPTEEDRMRMETAFGFETTANGLPSMTKGQALDTLTRLEQAFLDRAHQCRLWAGRILNQKDARFP